MANINTSNAPILSRPPKNDPMEIEKILKGIGDQIGQSTEKALDTVIPAALGPLNLVLSPIQDLFGIDAGKGIKDGLKKVFSAPTGKGQEKVGAYGSGIEFKKRSLTEKEIMKVDPGAAYIARQIGADSDEDGSGLGGILGSVFGGKGASSFLAKFLGLGKGGMLSGALAKMLPMVGKLGLIGGIIWAVMDGITGFFKADEWGTSKFSGVVGAVLGGVDTGLKGVFKNVGKWALIGAGIGSMVPGIGTLVGGLIGAAVGGYLSIFGGEKLAIIFDTVGKWMMENVLTPYWNIAKQFFTVFTEPFVNLFNRVKEIMGDEEKTAGQRAGSIFANLITLPINWIRNWFINAFINEKGEDGKVVKKALALQVAEFMGTLGFSIGRGLGRAIMGLGSGVWNNIIKPLPNAIVSFVGFIADFIGSMVGELRENPIIKGAEAMFLTAFNFYKDIFDKMVTGAREFIGDPIGFITVLWENIQTAITDFFVGIFDWLTSLSVRELFSFGTEFLSNRKNQEERVNDAIITSSGKVIHTHPDDNIVATKNDLRLQQDLDSMSTQDAIAYIDDKETHNLLEELISVIRETGAGATNIINTPSRFSPDNMYAQLSAVR